MSKSPDFIPAQSGKTPPRLNRRWAKGSSVLVFGTRASLDQHRDLVLKKGAKPIDGELLEMPNGHKLNLAMYGG